MKKILALLALAVCAALVFSGCSLTDMAQEVGDSINSAADSITEPETTPIPELTAPLFTDYKAVYVYYDQVTFADTLDTLTGRYGEPSVLENENGKEYTWLMEDGYGFTAAFRADGSLMAKVVYYEDVRQFREISNSSNLSVVENFDKEVDFQTCVSTFSGRPIEICQIRKDETDVEGIQRVYTWLDLEDNMVQILFNGDGTVSAIGYNFK